MVTGLKQNSPVVTTRGRFTILLQGFVHRLSFFTRIRSETKLEELRAEQQVDDTLKQFISLFLSMFDLELSIVGVICGVTAERGRHWRDRRHMLRRRSPTGGD